MRRKKLLKIVNTLLGIVFLNMAVTGLLSDSIPYNVYHILHGEMGKILVLLVVAHLTLNWNWVKLNYLKKKKA